VAFARGSGNRLTSHDRDRFPGDSLFDRLARVVCEAGCLPRKELYEAWEVARRVRRVFRGGRVTDLAGGHGLLGHAMLLLDDSSPTAVVVDPVMPKSARTLHDLLVQAWPRLDGRVEHLSVTVDEVQLGAGDVVVSCHACGALTDLVLSRAATARARVAVLPCCHDEETCDMGGLGGWLESSLAIDVVRATRLEGSGYRVWTQTIPADITPKNRLLLGVPVGPAPSYTTSV
jgi:hypothetical protein